MAHQPTSRHPVVANAPAVCSILLVEDDLSLRRSLTEFLKDSGYQPYPVGTMAEAWPAILELKPAVCLLDLNLPDGSGLDLLRRIVAEKLTTRVIVMTAFPLHHLQPSYPASTLAGWFTKPVPPGALLDAIHLAMQDRTQG